MTDSLRPEVLPPPRSYLARVIVLSLGCGAASLVSLLTWAGPRQMALAAAPEVTTASTHASVPIARPRARPASSELLFVFRAGGATYVRLADLAPDKLPKHGRMHLVDDDTGTSAIGTVRHADLPPAYRSYLRKQLRVDADCRAHVVGFAVVARLVGDSDHAGIEDAAWTATSVTRHGARVLAARIVGCANGTYARDASLPEIVRLEKRADEELASSARVALLASAPAAEAQREWKSAALDGSWSETVDLDASVLQHPATGVTWVTVHAIYPEIECGGPDINLWGLFRVNSDRTLEPVDVRKLDTLYSIDHVLDVEGDGDLELVGHPWLGLETVLVDANGEHEVDRLRLPFYGCPC